MPYADPDLVAVINPGDPIPAAWTRVVRDDLEFLIDPPGCSVFHSVTQTIADATLTTLSADSEDFDNDGMHSTTANTSRITAQTPGRYLLIAAVTFDPNGTGPRRTRYQVNGTTTVTGSITVLNGGGGLATGIVNVRRLNLAAGDYVEIRAYQASGGSLDVELHEFSAGLLTR